MFICILEQVCLITDFFFNSFCMPKNNLKSEGGFLLLFVVFYETPWFEDTRCDN